MMESRAMMTESMKIKLRQLIVDHEGYERFPYCDTKGNQTIGIGYNLTARGLPDSWINNQYDTDVNYFYNQLSEDYEWFRTLDNARQIVIIDMCFMGYKTFQTFEKLISAMEKKDYEMAQQEILDSNWASEVKGRAIQDAQIMLTGEI